MIQLSTQQVLIGLGALLAAVTVWRLGRNSARRTAEAARGGARLFSLIGRVVLAAAAIVGVQWVVFAYPLNTVVRLAALGVPALFAAHTLIRALTVTTVDVPRKRGGRR